MAADNEKKNKMELSGLLNFADGLWSSLGDERIVVMFTTNHKDWLDDALLRPGRMDYLHLPMSYLTPCGFRTFAFNYPRIKDHPLFGEIVEKLKEVVVTPAELAEQLMRSNDADVALGGLQQGKKDEKRVTSTNVDGKNINGTCDEKEQDMEVHQECDDVDHSKKIKGRMTMISKSDVGC